MIYVWSLQDFHQTFPVELLNVVLLAMDTLPWETLFQVFE